MGVWIYVCIEISDGKPMPLQKRVHTKCVESVSLFIVTMARFGLSNKNFLATLALVLHRIRKVAMQQYFAPVYDMHNQLETFHFQSINVNKPY
ncbi:hypothetical protein CHH78_16420 [Shouchella clausii]|jgi:hypothetical protein|uniref:Uncharacterized protein n=1 Tax=Shouchella clausii TaxID=79880 RepID=A0A268RX39_SHOCL|nr:hypothetical protein BC8716_21045 [Shouchella clausii]PAD41730.1 hypothetical protein CHH54_15625 [Bacillus sp. 7520-S]PAD10725.1 hypothetical protein CHH76_03050 [Shouchella clausii]PAD12505.1 hypothetical protein CHH74_15135 [Shouchella clausii]PAD92226.1 hypothetical protein CHH52_10865 [Shouchella clausii]